MKKKTAPVKKKVATKKSGMAPGFMLINFRVKKSVAKAIDAKAAKLTKGNRTKLLALAALSRSEPFGPKAADVLK